MCTKVPHIYVSSHQTFTVFTQLPTMLCLLSVDYITFQHNFHFFLQNVIFNIALS